MSYILDALKKSEQQRGHGQVPGVQTIHSSSLNYHNGGKRLWPTILIIAVLLNFLAISYFIYTNETKETVSVSDIKHPATVEKAPLNNTEEISTEMKAKFVPLTPTTNAPAKAPVRSPVTPVITEAPEAVASAKLAKTEEAQTRETTTETTSFSNDSDLVDFHSLPESTRSQIPAIIITAHVYSSNPLQRSVVINNNFMEEGEYILDDLILLEITPDGAIFQFHETRFSYGVVSGWQ